MYLTRVLAGPPAAAPLRRADDLAYVAARAVAGDRNAFASLMSAHKDALYRFVRRRIGDREDAYDVVQETFVAAWQAIERYDPNRSFGTWVRSIALNKCRDRARRAKVRFAILAPCSDEAVERMPDDGGSPEEALIARSEMQRLATALSMLPDHLKEALTLTTIDCLPQAAAAEILGCSIKAVEYRVARAREMLTCALRDGGE